MISAGFLGNTQRGSVAIRRCYNQSALAIPPSQITTVYIDQQVLTGFHCGRLASHYDRLNVNTVASSMNVSNFTIHMPTCTCKLRTVAAICGIANRCIGLSNYRPLSAFKTQEISDSVKHVRHMRTAYSSCKKTRV